MSRYKDHICDNCTYYEADDVGEHLKKHGFGECRRRAPSVLVERNSTSTSFPVTFHTEWCGEFEREPQQ